MTDKPKRPDFVVNRVDIESPAGPPNGSEDFGFASELSAAAGINHFRAAHLRILPDRRAYPPMALEDDEVFALVIEGTPDLWLHGNIHRLSEGDGVALQRGTGIAHSLINNTNADVRVFVMTNAFGRNTRAVHPGDDAANDTLRKMDMLWDDYPVHKLGPNSGQPGDKKGRKREKPEGVENWRDIISKKASSYSTSDERQGQDALFGKRARFSRLGAHFEVLKPGRRTSWPHAERDEDEYVYVVKGSPELWTDGWIDPLSEGDFVGWRAGTGITHVVINNGAEDVWLIVGGEASRARNQFWYPFHPWRQKEIGELYWFDHPVPKFGQHDGLPDALRAKLPKKAFRSAMAANAAARNLGKRKR